MSGGRGSTTTECDRCCVLMGRRQAAPVTGRVNVRIGSVAGRGGGGGARGGGAGGGGRAGWVVGGVTDTPPHGPI